MTDIYKKVYDTIALIGYPVKEQGTYGKDETLPVTFVTYQLIDSPNNSHADNAPTSVTHRVQVSLYSKTPTIKQGADAAIKAVMLPAKFMRVSGRDLPYSADTGHYGFTSDYRLFCAED